MKVLSGEGEEANEGARSMVAWQSGDTMARAMRIQNDQQTIHKWSGRGGLAERSADSVLLKMGIMGGKKAKCQKILLIG